jgi:hypothetical protein
MIEVTSDQVLRDILTVEIPLLDGSGSTTKRYGLNTSGNHLVVISVRSLVII